MLMKVLIADDDVTTRRKLTAMFTKWGFEVVVSCDGDEAWQILQAEDPPKLVILDWMMPGIEGVEICRRLRRNDPEAQTYIIILTAMGNREDMILGLESGADDYIVKPFDSQELLARVKVGKRLVELQLALAGRLKEIQRQEQERRNSEETLRVIFNNVYDALFIHGVDGKIIDVNDKMLQMYGVDRKQAIGLSIIDDFSGSGNAGNVLPDLWEKAPVGKNRTFEWVTRRPNDGSTFTVEVFLSTLIIDGKPCILANVRDITERRALEAKLRHTQKMEAIGLLAGGIAHDFNNIITAIVGYGELLRLRLAEDEPLRYFAEQILCSAERAAELTGSLLAFSRKQKSNPQPVDMNLIISKVEKFLKRLIGEDIQFGVGLAPELMTIMADSGQMEQVLVNLVTNARDSMRMGGQLTISTALIDMDVKFVHAHGYGNPGRYAQISVTDTGDGMDEEVRHKIFEPYFTTKEVGKGTGLGMAIIYGIIKQHKGYIAVYSEKGVGTSFKIYLPLYTNPVLKAPKLETAILTGGQETILLAEDDYEVRQLTKELLMCKGYTVIEAFDGNDAVQNFMKKRQVIKLLILDMVMPNKNGKEVYNQIKILQPDIKVLFTSGYPADVIHAKGMLIGDFEFITKPTTPHELLLKVRKVLDSKECSGILRHIESHGPRDAQHSKVKKTKSTSSSLG